MARGLIKNTSNVKNVSDGTTVPVWKVIDGNDTVPKKIVWFEELHFEGKSFADDEGLIASTVNIDVPGAGIAGPSNGRGFAAATKTTHPNAIGGEGWTTTMHWGRCHRRYIDTVQGEHMVATLWGTNWLRYSGRHDSTFMEVGGLPSSMIINTNNGINWNTSSTGSLLADEVTSGSGYFVVKLTSDYRDIAGIADPYNGYQRYYQNKVYVNPSIAGTIRKGYMMHFVKEGTQWGIRFYFTTSNEAWQYKTSDYDIGSSGTWRTNHGYTADSNFLKISLGSRVQRKHSFGEIHSTGTGNDGYDHRW